MELFLIPHGLTEPHEGRCVGQHEVALAPTGRQQMERLSVTWGGPPPDLVISSDSTCAVDAAKVLNQFWKVPHAQDARLRDMNFGVWENEQWAAIEAEYAKVIKAWRDDWTTTAPPEGESFEQMAARAKAWLRDMQAAHAGADRIVVVGHARSLRALLCAALSLPLRHAFQFDVRPARVTVLRTSFGGFVLCALNRLSFT